MGLGLVPVVAFADELASVVAFADELASVVASADELDLPHLADAPTPSLKLIEQFPDIARKQAIGLRRTGFDFGTAAGLEQQIALGT